MKSALATITPSAPSSGTALDVLHVPFEGGACGGGQRRQVAEHHREPAQQRQHPVSFGLLPPQLRQFGDLVRMLGAQISRLGEVVG
jgi:hypothetical protein